MNAELDEVRREAIKVDTLLDGEMLIRWSAIDDRARIERLRMSVQSLSKLVQLLAIGMSSVATAIDGMQEGRREFEGKANG